MVHTVGLLLEDDYKEILHSQNFDELSKSVQTAIRGQNPLDTRKTPKTGLTYEKVNRDTGMSWGYWFQGRTLLYTHVFLGSTVIYAVLYSFFSFFLNGDMMVYECMFVSRSVIINHDFLFRLLLLTYEMAAITVANEAAKEGIESFAFVSAAFAPPMVPNRYVTTKREAETALLTHPAGFRPIIFRPGFLSTPDRPVTLPLAGLLQVSSAILGDSVRGTIPFAQALSTPPLEMETFARAIVNSLENPEVRGIIDVEGIAELANNPHTQNVGASKKAVEEKKEPKDGKLE